MHDGYANKCMMYILQADNIHNQAAFKLWK